jgi:hypothetical protein
LRIAFLLQNLSVTELAASLVPACPDLDWIRSWKVIETPLGDSVPTYVYILVGLLIILLIILGLVVAYVWRLFKKKFP